MGVIMAVTFRNYSAGSRYGEDYNRLRRFYLEIEALNYPFGRWDWMISHTYLNEEGLSKIGMWFDNDIIVGVSTYDTMLDGKCFFVLKTGYEFLQQEMITYAENNLANDGKVLAPDGNFASYCGMWQDGASQNALVEPVATDPAYRKMGLGRAAVLEAVRRCGLLGAKRAYVDSSQQFYYNIGFRPCITSTFWERKTVPNNSKS